MSQKLLIICSAFTVSRGYLPTTPESCQHRATHVSHPSSCCLSFLPQPLLRCGLQGVIMVLLLFVVCHLTQHMSRPHGVQAFPSPVPELSESLCVSFGLRPRSSSPPKVSSQAKACLAVHLQGAVGGLSSLKLKKFVFLLGLWNFISERIPRLQPGFYHSPPASFRQGWLRRPLEEAAGDPPPPPPEFSVLLRNLGCLGLMMFGFSLVQGKEMTALGLLQACLLVTTDLNSRHNRAPSTAWDQT